MSYTRDEIDHQPEAWRLTLAVTDAWWDAHGERLAQASGGTVVFTGCGTSYHLAHSAARLWQLATGHRAIAVPASEVFLSGTGALPKDGPLTVFAISRSGTTTEVRWAVEQVRRDRPGSHVVAVTCHEDSDLARLCEYPLVLPHAAERSVVMTQSFTSMLLALQRLAVHVAGRDDLAAELDRLPDLLTRHMAEFTAFGQWAGAKDAWRQYIFLGLGPYEGLAREATLKLKEMTQVACEAYNPLEFRHGPISMVAPGTVVVSLVDAANAAAVQAVGRDVARLGGSVIELVPEGVTPAEEAARTLVLPPVSDWSRAVLYMPALHHLALARAEFLGLNPDQPRHLTQVVTL
ncbi:MAG: SIS domain-containing protein [Alicyclobacillus macrosporangiidus]|uniref:SIS domain-containing protein n=1 Tax=Alicyclobacillus macrosporangiidus TaxID=392015 RepID=UPI0026EBD710|nr:SIS domain-containing protein [Alicyclobacillus macrosporangiidus]MCL6600359.1 SIS domain-containing protein [Alicyclobacillus macrosporangiidus]